MEKVELPIHRHPLLPITRFSFERCYGCEIESNIYGGYRCNELGCEAVFHRDCAESLPEITHFSHSDHPLKLLESDDKAFFPRYSDPKCCVCGERYRNGYICSICNFTLHLRCAKGLGHILENSDLHQHPLELFPLMSNSTAAPVSTGKLCYRCYQCDLVFHVKCAEFVPEAIHISHPQHPLKLLTLAAVTDYAEDKCLLCGIEFPKYSDSQLHYCDICNFCICKGCMKYPPPVRVESPTTHEHELHLVPRRIDFTCNACGTLGDRSPYFCLQCNFMIHRECIDLPRVININRHDHRISYTRRLGHGEEWKCKTCRKKVDGFYGGYTCIKCPSFAVHSRCATRKEDVWDMIELEGIPEEEEITAPFEVIDANTIKHFSHDHNLLQFNKDGLDRIQPESIVCEACLLQILSEPSYSCEQCNFILHEKCANHPRKKRHVLSNQPFTLLTDSRHEVDTCEMCKKEFTGFRYKTLDATLDVRCAAISDTLEHESHKHPLYYYYFLDKHCSRCRGNEFVFSCDECDYKLDGECASFPKKVMKIRYDDHPLFLSFGDMDVDDDDYWCEACEAKVNPKEWFYTCYECGTILHISCVVGDFSYIMPGTQPYKYEEVVSNTSICRPLCASCKSLCKLPSIYKMPAEEAEGYEYFCSSVCSTRIYG